MAISWFWEKTIDIKCQDGSVRRVFKNLDHAVPLYIKGWKSDITADVKNASSLSGKAKAKFENQINGILYGLNEQNQSLMMSFRTVYLAFSSNPCGGDAFFQREIEKLLDEQRKITSLKIQINGLIQLASTDSPDTTEITRIFGEITSRLGGPASASASALEISDARNAAKHLISGA